MDCPSCHEPMEQGEVALQIRPGLFAACPRARLLFNDTRVLEEVYVPILSMFAKKGMPVPGFRCPACGIVAFHPRAW